MLPLALLALWTRDDVVVGLRSGETAIVLGANDLVTGVIGEDNRLEFLRPRVLDAATGQPLANVLLEAWTESGQEGIGFELCVDRTITQRDGTARLRARVGSATAEKVRLSCAGHASRTVSASDMFDDVLLFAPMPLEGRVLDLEDHPVANAIVRTRETCSHAIPAAQTRTDAFGRFRLEDCPTAAGGPELEVVGAFTEPLYQLDVGQLRARGAAYGELVLRVAHREPLQLQLVDHEGVPMAGQRIHQRNVPTAEAWTDKEGFCTLSPPAEGRDQVLYVSGSPNEVGLTSGEFPVGIVSVVRPYDSEETKRSGRVHVEFEGPARDNEDCGAEVFDLFGNIDEARTDKDALVVPGAVRVVSGASFSGWRTQVRDVVVGDEPLTVTLTPEREPVLHVKPPSQPVLRLVVQAGHDSISRTLGVDDTKEILQPVPANAPIIVFLELLDGEQRRLAVPPIASDTIVDLTPDSTVLRPRASDEALPFVTLRGTVSDSAGNVVAGLQGSVVVGDLPDSEIVFDPTGRFTVQMRTKLPYRLALSADGFRSLEVEGAIADWDSRETIRHFVLHRNARLQVRGPIEAIDVGGPEPEAVEGGFDLEAAPGPLTMRIARTGQPPIALDLVLTEGETRRIDVR